MSNCDFLNKIITYTINDKKYFGYVESVASFENRNAQEIIGYFPGFTEYEYKLASGPRIYVVSYSYYVRELGKLETEATKKELLKHLIETILAFKKKDTEKNGAAWAISEELLCARAVCMKAFDLTYEEWSGLFMEVQ